MKHFLINIIILLTVTAIISCSDDFVNEKLNIQDVALSAIIISPDWDADDYQFQCEGTENAEFTVISKPEWLNTDSNSGKFINGIATIHCSADTKPDFSETGIYLEQMIISSNNKKYAVPVYYIAEGNPAVQVNRTLEIVYNNYSNELQITNTGNGILLWDIADMPRWLTINMDRFNPMSVILGKNEVTSIHFDIDSGAAMQSGLSGKIILVTNDKNNEWVEIVVTANLGTPKLGVYDENFQIEYPQTSRAFYFNNYGDGLLVWSFEGIPDWLSISQEKGIFPPHSTAGDIIFTCDQEKLEPGLNSATIYLRTNDPENSLVPIRVFVRMPGSGANIYQLEGSIVDIKPDKNSNTVFCVTEKPNLLVQYDLSSRAVLHEVALSKAPKCLAVSEDFKKAFIGHNGMMSIVDLKNFSVIKTYESDFTIYDAEWAEDDWFCYTQDNSNSSYLFWINTLTGEKHESTGDLSKLGTAKLVKIPGQPYILASRVNISPTGNFVFDIETKSLKSYTHESLENYWFFNDAKQLVNGYSYIMRTSSIISASGYDNITPTPTIGELKQGESRYPAWWVDFSETTNSIWAIFSFHSNYYYEPVRETIYQFEGNDYALVRTYLYDGFYQPDSNTPAYEVEAHYVFANREGTELSVFRKGKNNNNWSVEFIPVL